MEWGGAPSIDENGEIERTIKLPAGVYEAIERAIAKGEIEGMVIVTDNTRVQWQLDR